MLPKKESSNCFTASGGVVWLLDVFVAEFLDALEDGVAVAVEGSLELGIVVDDLVEEAGHVVVDDVVFFAQFLLGGEDDLPADAKFVDGSNCFFSPKRK